MRGEGACLYFVSLAVLIVCAYDSFVVFIVLFTPTEASAPATRWLESKEHPIEIEPSQPGSLATTRNVWGCAERSYWLERLDLSREAPTGRGVSQQNDTPSTTQHDQDC